MVTTRNQRRQVRQRRVQRLKDKIRRMLRILRVVEEYLSDLRIEYEIAVDQGNVELAESILPKKQDMERSQAKKRLAICRLYNVPKYRDIYVEARHLAFEEGYRSDLR